MSSTYQANFWRGLIEEFHETFDAFDDRALEVSWHPFTEFIRICGRAEGRALRMTPKIPTSSDAHRDVAARDALLEARVIDVEHVKVKTKVTVDAMRARWRVIPGWRDRLDGHGVGLILAALPDGD